MERETLAVTVWLVVDDGNEVGVAVMVVDLVAPGAMLRDPLEGPAETAPVAPAPIENEPGSQTELSLLTIVSV